VVRVLVVEDEVSASTLIFKFLFEHRRA